MNNKKIDVDKLFNLFPDESEGENDDTHINFKDSPVYWIGIYKKLILNHINFNKKVIKFFKEANSELDVKDMKEAGEFVTYSRAWNYIKKIDFEDDSHLDAIYSYSDEYLETTLELGIQYFQNLEEYEKCAQLLKILKISQNS
tara:strand:- start:445 stop:873 length:429 start_codon:yes stop_codon:yes gene_type:complete